MPTSDLHNNYYSVVLTEPPCNDGLTHTLCASLKFGYFYCAPDAWVHAWLMLPKASLETRAGILKKASQLNAAMATLSLPVVHLQVSLWRQGRRRLHGLPSCQFRHAGRVQSSYRGLEALYDDGYGTVKDLDYYYQALGQLVEHDSGPPCWLCPVDAGSMVDDAPLMLYLPGKRSTASYVCLYASFQCVDAWMFRLVVHADFRGWFGVKTQSFQG